MFDFDEQSLTTSPRGLGLFAEERTFMSGEDQAEPEPTPPGVAFACVAIGLPLSGVGLVGCVDTIVELGGGGSKSSAAELGLALVAALLGASLCSVGWSSKSRKEQG